MTFQHFLIQLRRSSSLFGLFKKVLRNNRIYIMQSKELIMKNTNGFTFFELIISLAIIGILLSLSLPGLSDMVHTQRANAITNDIYHSLIYTRNKAIRQNTAHTICPSDDHIQCIRTRNWSQHDIIIFSDNNLNATIDSPEELLRVLEVKNRKFDIQWRAFQNKRYIQWLPSGLTNYQNGSFKICPVNAKPQYARSIILNAIGRPYISLDRNNDGIREDARRRNLVC